MMSFNQAEIDAQRIRDAAPELLESCRELLAALVELNQQGAVMERADRRIAKALGILPNA